MIIRNHSSGFRGASIATRHRSTLRFKRFCRAGWAAFRSLHREVTIGRLATRVADSSLAKSAVACCMLAVVGAPAMAQTADREARTLAEVEVTLDTLASSLTSVEPAAVLTASDFRQTSIRSIADLVALLPGVDLRTRGGNDVQADLSMRGGTFDQMLVLLGGINLTDAQTGHHTLDIPIDISMVERVELLTPSQCMARGIVAFCGAVNIVVSEQYRDHLLADVSFGSYASAKASVLGTKALGRWSLTAAAAYNRSDGYRPNTDYRHGSIFLQGLRHGDRSDLHLQLGGQFKDFGGAGFYSTTFPDQYEATRTLMFSGQWSVVSGQWRLSTSAYGRLHRDRFELFRDGYVTDVPAWYSGHNHHLSSLAGASGRAVRRLGKGEWVTGVEMRREGICSNVLGLRDSTLGSPYTHSATRLSWGMYTGYGLRLGRFATEATALGLYSTHFGFHYGLSAGCHTTSRFPMPGTRYSLEISRTFRLPTFTDLYYESATQQASPDLGAESSTGVELKMDSKRMKVSRLSTLQFRLSTYYRAGRDIIGWVRQTEEDFWLSMNHNVVDALGIDAQTTFQLSIFNLQLSYSFCHVEADSRGLLSSSAIEHLRHRMQTTGGLRMERFSCYLSATYRFREGQYVVDGEAHEYRGALLIDAAAEYALRRGVTLYLRGYNLLDASWRDLGGVPQPGATFTVGLRVGSW